MDFAYLPESMSEAEALNIRVPLLPDVNFSSPRSQTIDEAEVVSFLTPSRIFYELT